MSYHRYGHAPGNITIYAPIQQVLMVVDVVLPGWMSYRSLSLSRDIPGLFRQVEEIAKCRSRLFYMDRATIGCVNAMTDKWATRLAGFDFYIWEHCIAMEESLRAD